MVRMTVAVVVLMALACGALARRPAAPSIAPDWPIVRPEPAPSRANPSLSGPVNLLKSGSLDNSGEFPTYTLPLYYGYTKTSKGNIPYYYIVTDTSNFEVASALGINPSAKLKYAFKAGLYRQAILDKDGWLVTNQGYVDFSPERSVVPGDAPNFFPPKSASPGSVGVDNYSPYVMLNDDMYNMPIVADGRDQSWLKKMCDYEKLSDADKKGVRRYVHDRVVKLCLSEDGMSGTVTLQVVNGFSFGRPVQYLSVDAYPANVAALEAATNVPNFANINGGENDNLFSAVERLFAFTNGYTNSDVNPSKRTDGPKPEEKVHPARQGFNSALSDGRSPMNVLGGIPTLSNDYSPIWDVYICQWTKYAIGNYYRTRMTSEHEIFGYEARGYLTDPDGGRLRSNGIYVNCPMVYRFL